MEAAKLKERCGSPKRDGSGPCGKPPGWGTPYKTGPCVDHGGRLPNVRKHHAQVEALQFARGQLGQELDADPLEGVLMAVRLSNGLVDYWRHLLAAPDADQALHENYAKALDQYARICKLANDAGVSDRQIRILERMAEQLSLAFEEALAPVVLDAATRQAAIARFGVAIAKLESPVIDGTAQDVAA